ncbi:MAG: AMP-binding protein [Gammaproteobacteria bacterium]
MAAFLPLLSHPEHAYVAWWQDHAIDRAAFLSHVARVAESLPANAYAINLCEDRYLFIVAFAAALVRGQTNLLPANRSVGELAALQNAYGDSHALHDHALRALIDAVSPPSASAPPAIATDQIAAIAFTSGSTGQPKPNPKTWVSLVAGAQLAARRFNFRPGMAVVATVPPQHMYGLETSVLLPLIAGLCVHGGRPFFPDDLRVALAALPEPRVLITTPAHLRVCAASALDWPPLTFMISATAPLSAQLAAQSERVFRAPVLEIYGCTEAGSMASRRTIDGDQWRFYDGLAAYEDNGRYFVHGGHLANGVALDDVLEMSANGRFKLLGRHEDMVNIAGKRASLANLNHQLNAIPGVSDGAFIAPDPSVDGVQRLAALVVAPELSVKQIRAQLAQRLDPAFLPRPLYKVDALPRNATGKLPRQELLALLARLKKPS